jgi:hypothetical protein
VESAERCGKGETAAQLQPRFVLRAFRSVARRAAAGPEHAFPSGCIAAFHGRCDFFADVPGHRQEPENGSGRNGHKDQCGREFSHSGTPPGDQFFMTR